MSQQPNNRLGGFMLIGLLVAGYFAWQTFGGGGSHTVTYTVTGSASSASTTYQNESGNTSQDSGVSLPYTKTMSVSSGSFIYISAQNGDASGDLTCTITVDGVDVQSNTSTGGYSICQASERL